MKGFCPLASGSKGNSIFVGSDETKLLIDAGISARMLTLRLAEIGLRIEEIDAIVVTHEHTDHIRGLATLAKRWNIPIFANSDTARAIMEICRTEMRFKIFSTGEPFAYGDIEFFPFSIQHDAVDPVGFSLQFGSTKIGIAADLGFATSLVKSKLEGCDYLYLEANHQVEMVHACPRPAVYKQRVLGRLGHLSNDQCADLLKEVLHPNLKHVHLAHLSSECNAPDLALEIIRGMLDRAGASIEVSIAHQDRVSQRQCISEKNLLVP